jgi:hypothetical protein
MLGKLMWKAELHWHQQREQSKHKVSSKLSKMWRAKKARRAFSRAVAAAFVKKTDPNTGYEYYFHTATGESSWEVPKLVGKVANWGKKKKVRRCAGWGGLG